MEDEYEKYALPIPANVRLRMEIINGIGMKELLQTIVVGGISAVLAVILYGILGNYLISIGLFLGVTAVTFLIVMKDKNNQSILDIILNMIKFFKNQKYFEYVAYTREEDFANGTTIFKEK